MKKIINNVSFFNLMTEKLSGKSEQTSHLSRETVPFEDSEVVRLVGKMAPDDAAPYPGIGCSALDERVAAAESEGLGGKVATAPKFRRLSKVPPPDRLPYANPDVAYDSRPSGMRYPI